MGRKAKITRNSLFYSESDFLFDSEMAEDYVKQDINQTITLFKIDREKTVEDRWGETSPQGVIYKEPVELNVIYIIDKVKNKAHDKNQNLAHFQQIGNLKFDIFLKTLQDKKVEVDYGDYVGIQITPDQMEYFVVTQDGRADFDNSHTRFGYKPLYISCLGVPCDKPEFNGI